MYNSTGGNMSLFAIFFILFFLFLISFVTIKTSKFISRSTFVIALIFGLSLLVIKPFLFDLLIVDGNSMLPTTFPKDVALINKVIYIGSSPQRKDVVCVERKPDDSEYEESTKKESKIIKLLIKEPKEDFIKRIIAVPGDEIRIERGSITIYPIMIGINIENILPAIEKYQKMSHEDYSSYLLFSKNKIMLNEKEIPQEDILDALGYPPNFRIYIQPSKVFINGSEITEEYISNNIIDSFPTSFDYRFPKDTIIEKDYNLWLKIPKDSYFLLGDNRDFSEDSRDWGLVKREEIIGKVTRILHKSHKNIRPKTSVL